MPGYYIMYHYVLKELNDHKFLKHFPRIDRKLTGTVSSDMREKR